MANTSDKSTVTPSEAADAVQPAPVETRVVSEIATSPAPSARGSSFQISQEPVTESENAGRPDSGETAVEAHKFQLSPEPVSGPRPEVPVYEDLGQLPTSYQEETLFLTARDPRWLFCYWDFDPSRFPAANMRYGYAQFFLKILRVSGLEQEGLVEINAAARNWYVPVSQPDTDYSAEIGFFDQDNTWRAIVRSGVAHTPPDALAAEPQAADFATVPMHLTFERLLELVEAQMQGGESLIAALSKVTGEGVRFRAGQAPVWTDEQRRILASLLGTGLTDQIGLGSEEIDKLLRKALGERLHSESASGLSLRLMSAEAGLAPSTQSLFSAIGASWSAQPFSFKTERGFYMHVNAEIIFYGGTHPDATVTVSGKPIALGPDGSFRYHFTLPDGDFSIPIVATSPDRVETRSATLSFQRGTERVGEVGATGQPEHLSPLIGRQ